MMGWASVPARKEQNMSNRTMLEINHDTTPHGDAEILAWGKAMVAYLSSGQPTQLPDGVTWFGMRHHTDDCPLGEPPRGWRNRERPNA